MSEATDNAVKAVEEKLVVLSEAVVNEILNHLGQQAFTSVAGLINKLMADHAKHNPPEKAA